MKRWQAIGFAVFCLLGGSRWLADSAFPSALPLFEQESLHYLLIGFVALAILFLRRSAHKAKVPWLRLAVAGMLLLGVPALLNEAAHAMTPATHVALFALVPLFVAVGASAGATQGHGLMMPALVGLSGALLLLPFQFPSTVSGGVSFGLVIAAVLFTAGGSVWMYALLAECTVLPAVAILCGANAVVLGLAALFHAPMVPVTNDLLLEGARCIVLDLPIVFLLVWLLQQVEPPRLASRYFIVPLLSAAEGIILMRSRIEPRMAVGLALMVAGSTALLLWRGSDESEAASQLGLR
jgi:drug/metabolite transporter (DMT)-like permease